MNESVSPTAQQITATLGRLADRLQNFGEMYDDTLDMHFSDVIRHAQRALKHLIPGLEPPPDTDLFLEAQADAESALADGESLPAIISALRGLAGSPHAPQLWYLIGSACIELRAFDDAIRCLDYVLWVQPGHVQAKKDLEALHGYLHDQ